MKWPKAVEFFLYSTRTQIPSGNMSLLFPPFFVLKNDQYSTPFMIEDKTTKKVIFGSMFKKKKKEFIC